MGTEPTLDSWKGYLATLSVRHPIAGKMMSGIWDVLGPNMLIPAAGPAEEEDEKYYLWTMVWDNGRHHLEIDFRTDKEDMFWFYRDREDNCPTCPVGGDTSMEKLLSDIAEYQKFFTTP